MQVNFITFDQLAELLTEVRTLSIIDDPMSGTRMYVLDGGGYGDILAVAGPNGGAAVIYPPESFDSETGSIHDQARAALE